MYKVIRSGRVNIDVKLRLPTGLKCKRCVLQWWYRSGNNYGCEQVNGRRTCGIGRGLQETYANCADVRIQ